MANLGLDERTALEQYKNLLAGKRKKFTNNIWNGADGYQNAKECFNYMLDVVLRWNREDIINKMSYKIVQENGLGGMLSAMFNQSYSDAVEKLTSYDIKPWEYRNANKGLYTKQNCIRATRWLVEEKLKYTEKELCKVKVDDFKKYNLWYINSVYMQSLYKALSDAYPNKIKVWELDYVPTGYWNKDTIAYAVKEICEKENIPVKDIKQSILQRYGLYHGISKEFRGIKEFREYLIENYDRIEYKEPNIKAKYSIEKQSISKKRLVEMYRENRSILVIGKKTNKNVESIYSYMIESGLLREDEKQDIKRQMRDIMNGYLERVRNGEAVTNIIRGGRTSAEKLYKLSKELGLKDIYQAKKREKVNWDRVIEEVITRVNKGESINKICRDLGVGDSTVYKMLRQRNIHIAGNRGEGRSSRWRSV